VSDPVSTPPQSPPTAKPGNGAGRFFGVLLIVAGVLICLLSGLCSIVFGDVVLAEGGHAKGSDIAGLLVVIAIFGGIPFAGGLVSTIVGVGLYRASRARP